MLSSEHMWFLLAAVRSNRVADLEGGMSIVFRHVWELFFQRGMDIESGVLIRTQSRAYMLVHTFPAYMEINCYAVRKRNEIYVTPLTHP